MGHAFILIKVKADRSSTRGGIDVEVLEVAEIGRDLAEAYGALMVDQDCTFPDVNRFEVLSARRISARFRASDDLAKECFDGQRTVEAWEFEVFGHFDDADTVLKLAQENIASRRG